VREGELAKVMRPEALVGMLLAMGSGHKSTPKGGLDGLLEAALRGELREEPSGKKFGEGAYKNEPWSIVALRKRVYAIRAFYDFHLKDEQSVRELESLRTSSLGASTASAARTDGSSTGAARTSDSRRGMLVWHLR